MGLDKREFKDDFADPPAFMMILILSYDNTRIRKRSRLFEKDGADAPVRKEEHVNVAAEQFFYLLEFSGK